MLYRFHVANIDGKPKIPEWIKPVSVEPRGQGFEILVDEKATDYLRKRRYAIEVALPKSYLSVSAVKTYLRCPLQYYFSQVEGLKLAPKSALAFGSVTHKSVEVNYKQKLDSHEDLPVEHIQEVWSEEFDKLKDQVAWEEGEKPGELKDEGVAAVKVYMEDLAPTVQPILVEHAVNVPLEGAEYEVKLIIDLADNDLLVHDLKTSSKSPPKKQVENGLAEDIQGATYWIGFEHVYGFPPIGFQKDYLVRTKVPKTVPVPVAPIQDWQKTRLMKQFSYVARCVRDGLFYPRDPDDWKCTPEWCGFYDLCHKNWR